MHENDQFSQIHMVPYHVFLPVHFPQDECIFHRIDLFRLGFVDRIFRAQISEAEKRWY